MRMLAISFQLSAFSKNDERQPFKAPVPVSVYRIPHNESFLETTRKRRKNLLNKLKAEV
jgi:hypothetical protein